ncbi:hypothetical protein UMZ34_22780 [Halopseudomonas pachastrellae]|nr:hypothetical protein UMZ34_22780 [Halopseudomonas pachastrellae]
MLCAGAGFWLLQQHQPEHFARLLSGQWQKEVPAGELQGTLMGQPFAPDQVYWRGDQLIFAETAGERVRRSLVVRFDGATSLLQGTAIDLLPGDDGPWPQMVLQWYTGALASLACAGLPPATASACLWRRRAGEGAEMVVHLRLPAEHSDPVDRPSDTGRAAKLAWALTEQRPARGTSAGACCACANTCRLAGG